MPPAFDQVWESMGGGPSDLTFPDLFLGRWDVTSTLVKVDVPLGPDFVPDMQVRCTAFVMTAVICHTGGTCTAAPYLLSDVITALAPHRSSRGLGERIWISLSDTLCGSYATGNHSW